MWNYVGNARCTAVTDYLFAKCRTQQLLCCGVAILKTSGIQWRRTTITITLATWNKSLRAFISTGVRVNAYVHRTCFLYRFKSVYVFMLVLYSICARIFVYSIQGVKRNTMKVLKHTNLSQNHLTICTIKLRLGRILCFLLWVIRFASAS
jgi:hypothetical protein